MKLLLDGFWWVDGPPSGRNVVRSILLTWAKEFPQDRLYLRVPSRDASFVQAELNSAGVSVRVQRYPKWATYHALAIATMAASKRHFSAVISQNFCPPASTSPRLVFVHDALFVSNPEWFTWAEKVYLSLLRPSLTRATKVLTSSFSEAANICAVWPEVRTKTVTVGLSVPLPLASTASRRPRDWHISDPFVLTVGRLNVRKNLSRLIEAFSLVNDVGPAHLVIVGEADGAYSRALIPKNIASRVHYLGHVSDAELRWLYENCALFVFPSLGEGFGLPLIEANMFGARAVASDIPAFREVGTAAEYFNPTSADSIARAIIRNLDGARDITPASTTWIDVVAKIRQSASEQYGVAQ